jgi:hypothetical protein
MTMPLDLLTGRPVKQPRVRLPTKLIVRRSYGCEASRCTAKGIVRGRSEQTARRLADLNR